jgi:D-alanyl-lipoteichoic acid acyltransferase DltB (MBOAT superfamily)
LDYVLYLPLYIAGPIITFNDYYEQRKTKKKCSLFNKSIFKYFLRFLACFLLMEYLIHHIYVVAIKNSRAWSNFSTMDMFIMGYGNLKFIWLKVNI